MSSLSGLPRAEPYSPWERKHAFKPGFPFTDQGHRYWCFKGKCNVCFSSIGRLAQHEKIAHSRHPLTGDYGDWLVRVADERESDGVVRIISAGDAGNTTHRKLIQMANDFFERVGA